jgi:hypothetical protein
MRKFEITIEKVFKDIVQIEAEDMIEAKEKAKELEYEAKWDYPHDIPDYVESHIEDITNED